MVTVSLETNGVRFIKIKEEDHGILIITLDEVKGVIEELKKILELYEKEV
jgi:molybdate-binding protein